MSWEDVQALRRSERFQEAIDLGFQKLANDPDDFKLRTQLDWVFYGLVKSLVFKARENLKLSKSVPLPEITQIRDALRRFARLPKRRPDNALSNIVREVCKIASHFHTFPGFIRWVGNDGLADEDWQYIQREEDRYPPIALGVARALAKWVRAHHHASQDDIALALGWIDRVRPVAERDDALWLDWDKVVLLRRSGRPVEAARVLGAVVKARRNEFWVWAEAARLYLNEQPDLALACLCRALECGADPKFTVKVHLDLAKILAERGDFSQASREIVSVANIRQEQGWGAGKDLQDLIGSSWYDPSANGAENSKDFYAKHSQDALRLCFDFVYEVSATYLGVIVENKKDGNKYARKEWHLSRFSLRSESGEFVSIVGKGRYASVVNVGDPVTLIIGRQSENNLEDIIQVIPRELGEAWDCTDEGVGVVSRLSVEDSRMKIFINRDLEVWVDNRVWEGAEPPLLGQGVSFRSTHNPKRGRTDIFYVSPGPCPEADVRVERGNLRRNPKGFAFVDDGFVPPPLLENIPEDHNEVTAVLIYAKDSKKDRYGWRAVALGAS